MRPFLIVLSLYLNTQIYLNLGSWLLLHLIFSFLPDFTRQIRLLGDLRPLPLRYNYLYVIYNRIIDDVDCMHTCFHVLQPVTATATIRGFINCHFSIECWYYKQKREKLAQLHQIIFRASFSSSNKIQDLQSRREENYLICSLNSYRR